MGRARFEKCDIPVVLDWIPYSRPSLHFASSKKEKKFVMSAAFFGGRSSADKPTIKSVSIPEAKKRRHPSKHYVSLNTTNKTVNFYLD